MEFIKKNKTASAVALFSVISIIAIVVMTVVMKLPVVSVCVLILIEAVIAVMLHNAELWIHVVLLLAEICAGAVLGKTVIVLICSVIYIAATFTLKLFDNES